MRTFWTLFLGAALAITVAAPAAAQGNDNDYTPLNSRIKRDRQFPLDLPSRFDPARTTRLMRERSKDMLSQLTGCLYNRSHEDSLALLERTNLGFMDFRQIDVEPNRAVRIYGFNDCLRRVANSNQMAVQLRFTPGALRQWLLQEAYLDRYRDGPSWVRPGNVIAERELPLSRSQVGVRAPLDFADCVVQADPYDADYFFRAPAGSEDEKAALQALVPSLGPCLPQGQQMELNPAALRVWVGEALWHAANHNAPPAGAEGQRSAE
jgi:hypothetical protein